MEIVIYLSMFLFAGFVFGMRRKPKSDISIKTAMTRAKIEWMKTPEYKEHQEMMSNLKNNKIQPHISFANHYWTKS